MEEASPGHLGELAVRGDDEVQVRNLIEKGVLEQTVHSPDWLQTAVALESLDLLVSVDTSVAHLAGALGIPTVLMLSAPADWRWGQTGCQTFLCMTRCAWCVVLLRAIGLRPFSKLIWK